jgi:hypothetical protein
LSPGAPLVSGASQGCREIWYRDGKMVVVVVVAAALSEMAAVAAAVIP